MGDDRNFVEFWQSAPGDANKALRGEDPSPDKSQVATRDSWEGLTEMPGNCVKVSLRAELDAASMDLLRRGHIPEEMEDHWFMYCDEEKIRYFRSWSGIIIFEASYRSSGSGYVITDLLVNPEGINLNGKKEGETRNLFLSLVAADIGADWKRFWPRFVLSSSSKG